MKRKILVGSMLLAGCLLVQAHEFWISPLKFFLAQGEELIISFMAGENFVGESWELKKEEIDRLEWHHLQSMKDLKDQVAGGVKDNLKIPLSSEGTHMIVMQGSPEWIELEAEKFNAYLKEDGLDEVYYARQKAHTLGTSGRERSARYAKVLVQAGTKTDDTFKKVTGLPAEIIPVQNPYTLKKGDPVQFKILFQGKPLFGAKVRVWNTYNNRTTLQNIFSQQDGMIETHISNPGSWMVSFVTMTPSRNPEADWRSYRASLVFGVK